MTLSNTTGCVVWERVSVYEQKARKTLWRYKRFRRRMLYRHKRTLIHTWASHIHSECVHKCWLLTDALTHTHTQTIVKIQSFQLSSFGTLCTVKSPKISVFYFHYAFIWIVEKFVATVIVPNSSNTVLECWWWWKTSAQNWLLPNFELVKQSIDACVSCYQLDTHRSRIVWNVLAWVHHKTHSTAHHRARTHYCLNSKLFRIVSIWLSIFFSFLD